MEVTNMIRQAVAEKPGVKNFDLSISTDEDHPAWDAFLESTPGGHHTQTSAWGIIKGTLGWKAKRVVLSRNDQILGGAQILIKRTRLGVKVGYVTKGPLVVGESIDLARIVLRQIKEISENEGLQLVAIQPPNNGYYLVDLIKEMNFCPSLLELAPTASLVMDLTQGAEALLKNMKQKTRQHINRSLRCGLQISEASSKRDLDIFFDLYLCTAKRQGFVPFRRAYFDTLWDTLRPHGWISLLLVCFEGEPITGQILIPFGSSVIGKMIGWSGKHSDLRPNEAGYWSSILWALENGYRTFDFEGVEPSEVNDILAGNPCTKKRDIFKYGFNANPVLYPPAFDYIPNQAISWIYHRFQPDMEGQTLFSRMLEILRKR